jgi:hypothetical protein
MFNRSRRTATLVAPLLAVFALGSLPVNAGIVDVSDVTIGGNPYRTFQDTTTNLIWLDLDNFFFTDTTYNSLIPLLSGSGFHLATQAELDALGLSIPAVPANFAAEAAILGANYPGSPHAPGGRSLMWGIYEDGDPSDGVSYLYRYDYDTSWNYSPNVVAAGNILRLENNFAQDLSAWVVADAANTKAPEPGTITLLGAGLAGLAMLRRRVARS